MEVQAQPGRAPETRRRAARPDPTHGAGESDLGPPAHSSGTRLARLCGRRADRRDVVPSTYSVCLVNIERSAGLIDDGRHAHPHPYRPAPRDQDPALHGARKPRVTAPIGRPPAHRAASTAANRRPLVLGPAVPPVGRLDGCHLRRPTRHGDPVASDWLQALLDLEEPPDRARPPGRRAGGPNAHPTNVSRLACWPRPVPRRPRSAPRASPRTWPRTCTGIGPSELSNATEEVWTVARRSSLFAIPVNGGSPCCGAEMRSGLAGHRVE